MRVVPRALVLLQLASGVSGFVPLTPQAIRQVGHRYRQGGLDRALYEKERPGAAALLKASQRQRIIAMVCSDPPEGRARWTVRLVAEEAVKRRMVPRVGRESTGYCSSTTTSSRGGKKCGASPNSMKSTSPKWKMFWRHMKNPMIPRNRWCVWMRSPLPCTPTSDLPCGETGLGSETRQRI
jgi:hypothetical protein